MGAQLKGASHTLQHEQAVEVQRAWPGQLAAGGSLVFHMEASRCLTGTSRGLIGTCKPQRQRPSTMQHTHYAAHAARWEGLSGGKRTYNHNTRNPSNTGRCSAHSSKKREWSARAATKQGCQLRYVIPCTRYEVAVRQACAPHLADHHGGSSWVGAIPHHHSGSPPVKVKGDFPKFDHLLLDLAATPTLQDMGKDPMVQQAGEAALHTARHCHRCFSHSSRLTTASFRTVCYVNLGAQSWKQQQPVKSSCTGFHRQAAAMCQREQAAGGGATAVSSSSHRGSVSFCMLFAHPVTLH